MKKTLFKSLLLGFAALTALNASAENKLIVDDFELAPGETKTVLVSIEHDNVFNSIQLFLAPVEGLTFEGAFMPVDAADDPTWPKYNVRGTDRTLTVEPGTNLDGDIYKIVLSTYDKVAVDGYVSRWTPGTSLLFELDVKAADDFKGGQIVCQYCKGDYSDPTAPEGWVNSFEINNQVLCNITAPAAAGTPLKEIVENGVDGTEYTVKEDLAIVATAALDNGGYLFVTDGKLTEEDFQGNWMKVKAEGEVFASMKNMKGIKGGTLIGVLSEANCNQTLTITKAAEESENTASAIAWNLAQSDPNSPQFKFAPKVNEVILLTGYWFANENAFRGYSDQSGQSATAKFDWCDTEPNMQNGVLYKDIQSVAQLKKAWDAATTGAPAKVGANDDLSFQNYVVYPLAISESQVITGVDNLNASKDVVSVQYVNAAGMVSTTPFKGVNMVVTRYADGSQVTTKVVK